MAEELDLDNKAVQKAIDRVYRDIKNEASFYDLNLDILALNETIAQMKTPPKREVVENAELLQQAIIDYESNYQGDIELEMVSAFKKNVT